MTYNFATTKQGDTVNAVTMYLYVNDAPKDLTGAAINIWFRKNSQQGDVVRKMSINKGISIVDAMSGAFMINKFTAFPAGTYYYDIEFNFSGTIKTYVSGTLITTITSTNG